MDAIDYKRLKPTRDILQDIVKIIGRAQQVYLKPNPNYWHMGLEYTDEGLTSQLLFNDIRIKVDIQKGLVSAGKDTWDITKLSAQILLDNLNKWVLANKGSKPINPPEISTKKLKYDLKQAVIIDSTLNYANKILTQIKQEITNGVVSPVLLYPHHFDLALSWFPNRAYAEDKDEQQYTMGFSFGDENIKEPYFYTIIYPSSNKFNNTPLSPPAYMHTEGFIGAVLKYNDIITMPNPEEAMANYYIHITRLRIV